MVEGVPVDEGHGAWIGRRAVVEPPQHGEGVVVGVGDRLDKLKRVHAWAASLAEQAADALADEQHHAGWFEVDEAVALADRVETMQDRRLLEPADPEDCDAVVSQLVEELFGNTLDDDGEMTRESRQYADAIKARVATLMRERA